MMLLNAYTIYDVKARVYNVPFFVANDDVACRCFTQALQNDDNDMAIFPADYSLYYIGTFDMDTSKFVPSEHKHLLLDGANVVLGFRSNREATDASIVPEK